MRADKMSLEMLEKSGEGSLESYVGGMTLREITSIQGPDMSSAETGNIDKSYRRGAEQRDAQTEGALGSAEATGSAIKPIQRAPQQHTQQHYSTGSMGSSGGVLAGLRNLRGGPGAREPGPTFAHIKLMLNEAKMSEKWERSKQLGIERKALLNLAVGPPAAVLTKNDKGLEQDAHDDEAGHGDEDSDDDVNLGLAQMGKEGPGGTCDPS